MSSTFLPYLLAGVFSATNLTGMPPIWKSLLLGAALTGLVALFMMEVVSQLLGRRIQETEGRL